MGRVTRSRRAWSPASRLSHGPRRAAACAIAVSALSATVLPACTPETGPSALQAAADLGRLDPTLVAPLSAGATQGVIVSAPAGVVPALDGVHVRETLPRLNAALVDIDSTDAAVSLVTAGAVDRVDANSIRPISLTSSQVMVRAQEAWNSGSTGAGTQVAVLDTGVVRSECGGCTIVASEEAAPDDGSEDDIPGHHGTLVTRIVHETAPLAGLRVYDVFVHIGTGVDPHVNWGAGAWAVQGAVDRIIEANAHGANIAAANMSFGGDEDVCNTRSPFANAIRTLLNNGVVPVVAAGNAARKDRLSDPGCNPEALTVGAVYSESEGPAGFSNCTDSATAPDTIACYSQSADNLDVLAPASGPDGSRGYGTSFAAPRAAGAIAALRSRFPGAPAPDLIQALRQAGPMLVDGNGIGRHRLDIAAAAIVVDEGPQLPWFFDEPPYYGWSTPRNSQFHIVLTTGASAYAKAVFGNDVNGLHSALVENVCNRAERRGLAGAATRCPQSSPLAEMMALDTAVAWGGCLIADLTTVGAVVRYRAVHFTEAYCNE